MEQKSTRKDSIVPNFRWPVPTLNHTKRAPYIDFPIIYNAIKTNEPFYVDMDFIYCSSDTANTKLYKWNGNSYSEVSSYTNPDVISGKGFYAVSTTVAAYVTITELTQQVTRV